MFLSLLAALLFSAVPLQGESRQVDKAITLYEAGLYPQAMDILQTLPSYGSDALVDGYATLCACRMHSKGYENMTSAYLQRHSSSFLCERVRLERALDFFDRKEYASALKEFDSIDPGGIPKSYIPEFHFERGYSFYKCDSIPRAVSCFEAVDSMAQNDYSAPSRYTLGYILYLQGDFKGAEVYFEKSLSDVRFVPISNYYIINCHYQEADYPFVLDKGVQMFEEGEIPADRKAHLARIISESYLLTGDKARAREFWDFTDNSSEKYRSDFFFAGNLMYATKEWQGAVDNYSKVVERKDSLSQIAWYQMAFSYLNLRNRVSALEAFKNATSLSYDLKMTEDAHFNYAKLAFDLNGDTGVFGKYMEIYGTKVRGESIYSYMALACLQNKDYQGAIDFYDKIDILQGKEKNNYVHANYLRGMQLVSSGSYRKAAQCLKAVTYYTDRNNVVNQLARYALAETLYSDADYAGAQNVFAELYNASALDGMEQGEMLSYNAAWAAMRQQKYDQAIKWFGIYSSSPGKKKYLKDAVLRQADCIFASGDFAAAADAYSKIVEDSKDRNYIYPRYQCAVATGLVTSDADKTRWAKGQRKQKNLAKKIEILSPVQEASPGSAYYPEAMFELGKSLLLDKKQTPAVKVFLKIASLCPSSPYAARALLETGTVRRGNGNIKGAVECYKRVVEQMDSLGYTDDALMALESIYQSQNTPEVYLAYLEKIGRGNLRSDSDKQGMLIAAAQQIFYSGNYSRALASFTAILQKYPESPRKTECDFFIAECLRKSSDKVRACQEYRKVIDAGKSGGYYVDALKNYASLSYEIENWADAYEAFKQLFSATDVQTLRSLSTAGMMRSAYRNKVYEAAVSASVAVKDDKNQSAQVRREASMTLAQSYLSLSRREEALKELSSLASDPGTAEGAQAAFMIIQDCYEKADYEAVQTKVYAFSSSGSKQQYYLAKSFLVLGDSFVAQGKLKQAKATFQSLADGYAADDDIKQETARRIAKLTDVN